MFEIFKKRLPATKKTKKYLDKLPNLYLVVEYAAPAILTYAYSGKMKYCKYHKTWEPMVWQYDDFNGVTDCWCLRGIFHVTTGKILGWFFDFSIAECIVDNYKKQNFYFDRIVDEDVEGNGFDHILLDLIKPNEVRISWFKDSHFQDELYILLNDSCSDAEIQKYQWIPISYNKDIDVYLSQNKQYLLIDYYDRVANEMCTRTYDIQKLFDAAY